MLAVKAALVQYLIDQNMSADKTDSPSNASQTADEDAAEEESHLHHPQVYTENAEAEETEEGSLCMEEDSEAQIKSNNQTMQVLTRFMCKFCGCQFTCREDMDAHVSGHDDEKPPLKCGVCGKTYNTRSKLQRHVRVHSGERPFPCEVCGKRFPRSDHVKQHMRVHAKYPSEVQSVPNPIGLTQNRTYCRLCGVKFEQKSELSQHLLSHGFNKLYSCIYCGEVFESNEKLKAHKLTHENQFEEYVPVLSVPDVSLAAKSKETLPPNGGAKRRKVGRPRGSKSSNATKRRKEACRLGFAKFKIARKSGSEDWQAVRQTIKTEKDGEGFSAENLDQNAETAMPILERILKEGSKDKVKSEDEDTVDNDSCAKVEEGGDGPQMAISACYSLAEGQDNSDIPDIEEIRASTLTDGSNMILVPMNSEGDVEVSQSSDGSDVDKDTENEGLETDSASDQRTMASAVSRSSSPPDKEAAQGGMRRAGLVPSTATATATLMAIQQQVYPQIATVSSTANLAPSTCVASTTSTSRPTISLLPNVLAFRTHPILATPTLNLASTAVHPTAASIYNAGSLYNPLANFTTGGQVFQRSMAAGCVSENFPLGRKMMRCQYCCIWFEDNALGLLHQSLHSADEMDPFTCKKCLKRLGNRLEFTAHIIWHLDPSMEDNAVV